MLLLFIYVWSVRFDTNWLPLIYLMTFGIVFLYKQIGMKARRFLTWDLVSVGRFESLAFRHRLSFVNTFQLFMMKVLWLKSTFGANLTQDFNQAQRVLKKNSLTIVVRWSVDKRCPIHIRTAYPSSDLDEGVDTSHRQTALEMKIVCWR